MVEWYLILPSLAKFEYLTHFNGSSVFFIDGRNREDVSVLLYIVEELIFYANENPDSSTEGHHHQLNPCNFINGIVIVQVIELAGWGQGIDPLVHDDPEEETKNIKSHASVVGPWFEFSLISKPSIVRFGATE